MSSYREYNFDGIVGPTHHYGGLSVGNLASARHGGQVGNPRAAALEGLEKMRLVASLGVGQAVLPPQPRPPFGALEQLGYAGPAQLSAAYRDSPALFSRLMSASSMWAANAATVVPSCDTLDGRLHLLVANLSAMPHRSLEAGETQRVLQAIFADHQHFVVHPALPTYLGDEGAANQLRLETQRASVHLLGWGRSLAPASQPRRFVGRQSREASHAAQRLCQLAEDKLLLWQQDPLGIDAGAFHSDVLAVSNGPVLLLHERAFVDSQRLLERLSHLLGDEFCYCLAREAELPTACAVQNYPFNSQLLTLPDGTMSLLAPEEAWENSSTRQFLERARHEVPQLASVRTINVNSSMKNGGGPACLRLRVLLSQAERAAISARVFLDDSLYIELKQWILRHYRSELGLGDLCDPSFIDECFTALDELTQLLGLGSVYPFQQTNSTKQ